MAGESTEPPEQPLAEREQVIFAPAPKPSLLGSDIIVIYSFVNEVLAAHNVDIHQESLKVFPGPFTEHLPYFGFPRLNIKVSPESLF